MWPLSIWKNYVKSKEQRRVLQAKLEWLQVEEMRLSLEWNGMLVGLDHSIVFTSKSEAGLSQEYKNFLKLSEGRCRLGNVYAIKNKGRSTLSGTHNLFISYSQLELITGVSPYQYEEVIRKYEDTSVQIDLIQEQLKPKRFFNFFQN
ncbi:hypothetical protein [Cohnella sp. WQ 127256]|uniref:hypothetical protein n=1 Tax=Cohnella sp. WQ 127256 TaxID=2938790 RepID=UPI002118D872|nr:hypothetical protein [Cohnella sp. WQ 127256]